MKFNSITKDVVRLFCRPETRILIVLLACAAASGLQAQGGTPTTLAQAVGDSAHPWILWIIRILAGAMSAGGLYGLITGLNGNDEGFSKAAKVIGSLVLMGVGIYCLSAPDTIYNTLNLNQMFTA